MGLNQSLDKIVKVKGFKDGLLFIIQPEPKLSEVEEALTQHLSTLNFSLSGIGITLDIGSRTIETEDLNNLQQWLKEKYGMEIKRIIMDYTGTTQLPKNTWKFLMEPPIKPNRVEKKVTEPPGEKARVIRHTLRSGQREEFLEGDLVVLGDINPGAEIVASKDIIVLGALRGVAHAGALGDHSAVIIALNLVPTQLRIGDIVSRPNEEKQHGWVMEIARVEGETIVVEEYKGL
jgi:septum site-determining protein MinC